MSAKAEKLPLWSNHYTRTLFCESY